MIKKAFLATSLIAILYLFAILNGYLSLPITFILLMLLFVVSARIITEKKTKLSGTENKGNRKHNFSDKPCAQRTSTMKRANSLLTIKEYDDICNMEISGQSRVKKLEAEVDRFRQKISEQDTSKKKNARK